jgi:acetolactate synthase-1/2/3 large subunit
MQSPISNAEYIARYLEARGVTHVYELIGGMITFLIDALHQHTKVSIVSMHHEQAAGFAAEGWARITGLPGVAMGTSGPGATNLLTAIGSCYFDSVPAVFITGQVNRHEQKKDRAIRQLGFQETDIVAMAKPITKAAWLVNDPADLPRILDEAFLVAASGRPGPVLIDIPMDVQRHTQPRALPVAPAPVSKNSSSVEARRKLFLEQLAVGLAAASRPLLLVGGGIRSSRACAELRAFVDGSEIPCVHSLMGVDVLPHGNPHRVGMIGSYGNRWANLALAQSDFVLILGSRLDVRQTGSDTEGFCRGRILFHVDCEEGEMNNRVVGCVTLRDLLGDFIRSALLTLSPKIAHRPSWMATINSLKAVYPDTAELGTAAGINPNHFIHRLAHHSTLAQAFIADVGQHQMWAAQSLELTADQRFLTSGGMGAMGFALPAAIGATLAIGASVVIAGDGGFQLNIQELQTIARNRLPIKIVILNNRCHGMVRQFQESYFKGRYQSTLWGYDAPDFCAVAAAYGIPARKLSNASDIEVALAELWRYPELPFLLEVQIDITTNVYPKLAFGRTFGEMEPDARPLEMEGT